MIIKDKEILQEISNLNSKFTKVITDIQTVKDNVSHLKDDIKSSVLIDLKQYVDSRLLDYKKQMMDEYYIVLNKLIEFNKTLFMNNNQKSNLINDLENFLLKQKWDKEEKEVGNKIVNKGQEIIKKRKELWDKMLKEEKLGNDIDNLKIKVETYDEVIRGVA